MPGMNCRRISHPRLAVMMLCACWVICICSGCVVSRITEMNWQLGRSEIYADLSALQGDAVWKTPDGKAYVHAQTVRYQVRPAVLRLVAGPISFSNSSLEPRASANNFAWLEITPDALAYLTNPGDKYRVAPDISHFSPAAITNLPPRAEQIPAIRKMPSPVILPQDGSTDAVDEAVYIGVHRNGWGWLSLTLLPVSFVSDIVFSTVSNVIAAVIIYPGYGLLRVGTSLMNIEFRNPGKQQE